METIISGLTMYYGLDWIGMLLGFAGMFLLTRKNRLGFAFLIVAGLLTSFVSLLAFQYGFIVGNVVNIVLAVMGLMNWKEGSQSPITTPVVPVSGQVVDSENLR